MLIYIAVTILIFYVGKEFSITSEEDKPEYESVTQSGKQNLTRATVGPHGVLQQGEQSMCYTIYVPATLQISY